MIRTRTLSETLTKLNSLDSQRLFTYSRPYQHYQRVDSKCFSACAESRRLFKSSVCNWQDRWFSSQRKNDDETNTSEDNPPSLLDQVRTVPNMITITRMASTPVLAYWVATEQYWIAIGGCTVAAASDFLDGYLAKRYGWSTVLGTYLDPLADKLFVNTLSIGLWYSNVLPTPLVMLWATKDVLLLSGTALYLHKKHGSMSILTNSVAKEPLKVTPSMTAKVNTTLQFVTLVVGLTSSVVSTPPLLLDSLCWLTGCTTIVTGLSYTMNSGVVGNTLKGQQRKS